MSTTTPDLTKPMGPSQSLPAWIASGLLGLALGAGAMYLGLQLQEGPNDVAAGGAPAPVASLGAPPMMGGGGMGMGGMGGGGMGMGGGGGGKRNLTSLVGKLELLSRSELKLQVELDADQAKKVAAKLAEIDKAEKMTGEEAQSHLDALEALLTAEQKTTLGLISLPFGRQAGGGGGRGGGLGAAGRPGGGGASAPPVPPLEGQQPRADAPPMPGVGGGMGGGSSDENPFTQEANHKRLKDLLGRLAPAAAAAEPPETPAAEKPAEKPAETKGAE